MLGNPHRLVGVLLVTGGVVLSSACGGGAKPSTSPSPGPSSPSSSVAAGGPSATPPAGGGLITTPPAGSASSLPIQAATQYGDCLRRAGISMSNFGSLTAQQQAAAEKCAARLQISPSQQNRVVSDFKSCMARHGVPLPVGNAAPTYSPQDPAVMAAVQACLSLLPAGN